MTIETARRVRLCFWTGRARHGDLRLAGRLRGGAFQAGGGQQAAKQGEANGERASDAVLQPERHCPVFQAVEHQLARERGHAVRSHRCVAADD